jgi:nitrite reductase/ring-hydroxylating ferredoxin subunit
VPYKALPGVSDVSDQPFTPVGPDLAAGIPAASLQDGVPLLGHVERERVILVRRESSIFAVGVTCTHYGGPLAEGLVVDDTVRHACFDLSTSAALRDPRSTPSPVTTLSGAMSPLSSSVLGRRRQPRTRASFD